MVPLGLWNNLQQSSESCQALRSSIFAPSYWEVDTKRPRETILTQVFTKPEQELAVINMDAHFDLRPYDQTGPNSGTGFRQMFDETLAQNKSLTISF